MAWLGKLSVRPIYRERHFLYVALFCLAFFFLFTRGLTEVLLRKKGVSMALQILGAYGCFCLLLFTRPTLFLQRYRTGILLIIGMLLMSLLSGVLTSLLSGFHFWVVYVFFSFVSLSLLLWQMGYRINALAAIPVAAIASFFGWCLFLVATFEILSGRNFPGESIWFITRPASLTGSYLHYPIIMSLLTFVVFEWYQKTGKKWYLFSSIFFAIAPFVVFSRSGVFIVAVGFFLFACAAIAHGRRNILFIAFTGSLLFIGFGSYSVVSDSDHFVFKVFRRVFTAANTQAAGNSGRLVSWKRSLERWNETNMLLGERCGTVTNSTRALTGKALVAESSLLQQLENFGLAGCLFYYSILLYGFFLIHKEMWSLRSAYLAALGQTLFYQSIEVVAFIFLLFLFPWIADVYDSQLHHQLNHKQR